MDFVLTSLLEILSHLGHSHTAPSLGEYADDWDLIKCVQARVEAFRDSMDTAGFQDFDIVFRHLTQVVNGTGDPLPEFREALLASRKGYDRARRVRQKVDFTKLLVLMGFFVGCECPVSGIPTSGQIKAGRNRAAAAVDQLLEEESVLHVFEAEEELRASEYSKSDRYKVLNDIKLIMSAVDAMNPFGGQSLLHRKLSNGINIYSIFRKKTSAKPLRLSNSGAISSVTVGENGVLFAGSFDKGIKVWVDRKGSGVNYECVQTLKGHLDSVEALLLNEQGILFSGSLDISIRVWALQEFSDHQYTCTQKLTGHRGGVTCLAVSLGGLLFSGSLDNTIRVWESLDGSAKHFECIQVLTGHTSKICALAMHWSDVLFSASGDDTIRVWRMHDEDFENTANYECDQVLHGHTGCVNHITVDESGALFSGSLDKTIRIWMRKGFLPNTAIHSYECVRVLEGIPDGVSCLLSCLDGMLYSGSLEGPIQVWSAEEDYDYECIQTLRGHGSLIPSLAATTKGVLISCSYDESIRMWIDCF